MENSRIEWCDHTFNPWIGCTKVSPGCAHCYAEARDQRFANGAHWGVGSPRQRTTPDNWKKPLDWNGRAGSHFDYIPCRDGKTRRVESGTFPLAHGVPGRVGLLRGYGNAIVPQIAAEFIRAWLESVDQS